MSRALVAILLGTWLGVAAASSNTLLPPIQKAPIDLRDQASLQRGARVYMNYCAGCHSLKFMRYNRMATDMGMTDSDGNVLKELVMKNLIFTGERMGDPVNVAMTKKQGEAWFGKMPPDLSLIARVRGADWLYTYMKSFYREDGAPWGSNNSLFPDVGMPNVLYGLQGEQIPVYRTEHIPYNGGSKAIQVIDRLVMTHRGSLSYHQFDLVVTDLVNFLTYVGEPIKLVRQRMGMWVLLFLFVLLIPAYLLKKEFWKDVK